MVSLECAAISASIMLFSRCALLIDSRLKETDDCVMMGNITITMIDMIINTTTTTTTTSLSPPQPLQQAARIRVHSSPQRSVTCTANHGAKRDSQIVKTQRGWGFWA
jgi:hypothetical protein